MDVVNCPTNSQAIFEQHDNYAKNSRSKLNFGFFGDYANRALNEWRRRIWRNVLGIEEIERTIEEVDINFVRYRPEPLTHLCTTTKFTKHELQLLYRGFKEGCPSGLVTLEKFQEIYCCFFPQGDSSKYAEFIFNTFDRDHNGKITFDEFVLGLSILSRGTEEEKLKWVFELYDVDRDGFLSKDDMSIILESIYDMMGSHAEPPVQKTTVAEHVNTIFGKMDFNHDGLITLDEFCKACKQDSAIKSSLHLFDTVFAASPNTASNSTTVAFQYSNF